MLSKTTFLQIQWKSDDSCHACRNNCPWKVNVVPCYGVFGCWLENCYRYLITVTCKNDQQTSPWKFLWNRDDQCTSKKKKNKKIKKREGNIGSCPHVPVDQCRNYCPLKVIYSTFLFAACAFSGYDLRN
jgi:hypothetical protein